MRMKQAKLRTKAHELALTDNSLVTRRTSKRLLREYNTDAEKIERFIYFLQENSSTCSQPAEDWFLDHAGFILEQCIGIREQLKKYLHKRLPHLRLKRIPRLMPLCVEYFEQTEGELTEESLIAYIKNYQEISVLTISEIWAFPLFLRLALLRKLTELTDLIRDRREICRQAEQLLSKLKPHRNDQQALDKVMEESGLDIPLSGTLIVHLVSHLQEQEWEDDSAVFKEWLKCKLENGPESWDHIQSYEFQLQAAYQVQTGNVIDSLRKIERWNWQEIFEKTSFVEHILRQDHTGTYSMLDDTSRESLRNGVERIARRLQVPETRVAEQVVELAKKQADQEGGGNGAVSRTGFAAYYLLEPEGIKQLQKSLAMCGALRRQPLTGPGKRGTRPYLSRLAACSALFLVAFALWIGNKAVLHPGEWVLVLAALLFPASEWGVTTAHWLIECRKKPVPLLRYDYSRGIPEEAATMVVVPVIWSSTVEVQEMIDRLELNYLANRDPNIHFALLGDFADSKEETAPGDQAIVEAAREGIERLNGKYARFGSRFYLFQRRRLWNPSEEVWMGWERKRGKLVEFVELLRGNKETTYETMAGIDGGLPKFRYLITLDADTRMPIGSAQRMIATIHLPYNRPKLNKSGTRVIEGYGVLQPHIKNSYGSAMRTRLSSLWAGAPGSDPYAFAVSDPYQDGVGEGIFTGKGIFDVEAFAQVLCERIPENRVLSHDLLEGSFLRTGLLADIELIDDQPSSFGAYQKRLHRWVRGDWQLICWLMPRFADRRGRKVPVDLSPIARWQIIDNLRRSLMQPVLFALLCLGLTVLPGHPGKWLTVTLATLFLPLIRHCLNVRQIWINPRSLKNVAGQAILQLAVLPFQCVLMLDAIVRTLYRLFISKRRLLEWVSSAEVERRNRGGRQPILLGMKGGYVLILLAAWAAAVQQEPGPAWTGYALVLFWGISPVLISWLNRPLRWPEQELNTAEKEYLSGLAKQIWQFFEDHVTAEDHWLPPDNVQIDPPKGIAHRTSPTNIGLYLASVLAARDFGFIDTPGLIVRLERTVETIGKLEKWHGHLFNWIDTVTLKTLNPKYISTVDSGNFVCCLVAVKEGLAEWLELERGKDVRFSGEAEGNWFARGEKLVERIEELIEQTNFAPLFDYSTRLFSLGFDVSLNRRDPVLYDLMASESRQASFIAIALGQVPASHWHRLGRTMTRIGRKVALVSWSGTMFEYLMPCLLMHTYRKTVWDDTCRAVVKRQIDYARKRGVPFGISESGYYAFDYQLNYQYRAFGVPGLGFQRGLDRDLVVSPYSTILALPFVKRDALEHLQRLEELGARGTYGYYESVDFTSRRLPKDIPYKVIYSFMAHHQGMSFLALANALSERKMTDRFHRDKRVQAVELLLQERIPDRPRLIRHPAMNLPVPERLNREQDAPVREYKFAEGLLEMPEIGILSNGKLTTVVTDSGSGFILFGEKQVTRWRDDPVRDDWGNYIYIRDVTGDKIWSPAFQPARVPSASQLVQFGLDRITFHRKDGDIRTSLEIAVSPERNADVRKLTLSNTGQETRIVEVTTYYELALTNQKTDEAHPAFSKLFVETGYEEEAGCLVALRRPRDDKDQPFWGAHALIPGGETLGPAEVETDRSKFIGRGYSRSRPRGIRTRLRGTVGAVTDPVFVMRQRLAIQPGEKAELYAVICVGESKEEVMETIRQISGRSQVERTFQLASTFSQIELRHLHLTPKEASVFQMLAGRLVFRPPLSVEQQKRVPKNTKGQSGLWPYSISGDRPILLVRVADQAYMPIVAKWLTGYEYLRRLGLRFDLILLNESEEGYQQNLQHAIKRVVEDRIHRNAGSGEVQVLDSRTLSHEDRNLLFSVAHLVLHADGRSLKAQLRSNRIRKILPGPFVPLKPPRKYGRALRNGAGNDLLFFNGWGGFTHDGKEYRLTVKNTEPLPSPWINVLANPYFGCLVSELGTGYSWWKNSRECKLSPWSNDPVLDPPGEAGFFRDEESGEIWTLFPFGAPPEETYEVTHARGFTRFCHERNGIRHEATVFVPLEDSIKIIEIKLKNNTPVLRKLSFTYYVEWVLGVKREENSPFIVTEWDEDSRTLQARNTYQEYFRDATAFLGVYSHQASENIREAEGNGWSWTVDRREFIGRNGTLVQPAALKREKLSGKTGPVSDSCGALQMVFSLEAEQEKVIYVLLGCGNTRAEAARLAETYRHAGKCRKAFEQVVRFWEDVVQQTVVSTPSPEMDVLLNGWLLYQTLSCRMWARAAFYQAGGAYGFRDQLQDSLALMHTRPDLTRKQILLHAAHQYVEGDVQHWWHEETGRGIRTRFSDDYLWLPYAVARYIEHTEDDSLLDERVPYLQSESLSGGEHERYEETKVSQHIGTVYEHALRAIDLALRKIGEHGLPLIGIGDWNDGMSSIGDEGRGESVWLAWFLCTVLEQFVHLCRRRGDVELADRYRKSSMQLARAANEHAWDGQWYRRGFTDSAYWIGSIQNEECRIDAIAQSWSVISGAGARDKAIQAMHSFDRELVDRSTAIARLLTPPFNRTTPSPGYIQAYPPGIRENGGQYTHGVIWSIIAWCLLGEGEKAVELFQILNPVNHTKTPAEVRTYTGEPYAMAADVYTAYPHEGRAGWTWYTGAAGWMYQAGIEWILGLRRRGNRLYIRPCIPDHWPGFTVRYRYGSSYYTITVKNGNGYDMAGSTYDDNVKATVKEQPDDHTAYVDLVDDGQHHRLEIILGETTLIRGQV